MADSEGDRGRRAQAIRAKMEAEREQREHFAREIGATKEAIRPLRDALRLRLKDRPPSVDDPDRRRLILLELALASRTHGDLRKALRDLERLVRDEPAADEDEDSGPLPEIPQDLRLLEGREAADA